MQAAFHEHYAAQCGFCTSGFVMAAEALVAGGEVGRDEIIDALSGYVCRCTGYAKIVDAVAAASRGRRRAPRTRRRPASCRDARTSSP